MSRLSPAEKILQELGVTSPDEIDLEAIAYHLGARVRCTPLDGCEARIIGAGDKAVIAVNSRSGRKRQRFSIAHELGHWQFHRGKKLICRVEEMERDIRKASSPERVADNFAADLLMPAYLFKPIAQKFSALTFSTVRKIADAFDCSYTAAAIRLVESDLIPGFVICHSRYGRRWFTRSPSIPSRWFPKSELDPDCHAFNVVFSGRPSNPSPYRIDADVWFDTWDASGFRVAEQTMSFGDNEALTLIGIVDAKMLEERAANHF